MRKGFDFNSKPKVRILLVDALVVLRLLWDWAVRTFEALIVPLLFMGSIALIGTTIYRSFTWQEMVHAIPEVDKRITAENQVFLTLAQIFGGGFVLVGLYFTGKSFIIGRQSKVTERLSSAIESLASDDIGRRIGGIVSLASLLRRPSPDYKAVIDLLCSFIQTTTESQEYRDTHCKNPRADVQAALNVLGGRRWAYQRGERPRLDLRGSFLSGADFNNGNFRGARFNSAQLNGTNFFRAHVEHALFNDAKLEGSNFLQADLRLTSFFNSALAGGKFRRALLRHTNLTQAILQDCSFDGASIRKSTFGSADLAGATFDGARLVNCDFSHVPRASVNLAGASCRGLVGFT